MSAVDIASKRSGAIEVARGIHEQSGSRPGAVCWVPGKAIEHSEGLRFGQPGRAEGKAGDSS